MCEYENYCSLELTLLGDMTFHSLRMRPCSHKSGTQDDLLCLFLLCVVNTNFDIHGYP